jgi:hypothetical protein
LRRAPVIQVGGACILVEQDIRAIRRCVGYVVDLQNSATGTS